MKGVWKMSKNPETHIKKALDSLYNAWISKITSILTCCIRTPILIQSIYKQMFLCEVFLMQDIRVKVLKAILKDNTPKNLQSLSQELHIEPNQLKNELFALKKMGLVMLSKAEREKRCCY